MRSNTSAAHQEGWRTAIAPTTPHLAIEPGPSDKGGKQNTTRYGGFDTTDLSRSTESLYRRIFMLIFSSEFRTMHIGLGSESHENTACITAENLARPKNRRFAGVRRPIAPLPRPYLASHAPSPWPPWPITALPRPIPRFARPIADFARLTPGPKTEARNGKRPRRQGQFMFTAA